MSEVEDTHSTDQAARILRMSDRGLRKMQEQLDTERSKSFWQRLFGG
jgi:hypothetical protein